MNQCLGFIYKKNICYEEKFHEKKMKFNENMSEIQEMRALWKKTCRATG